MGMRIPACPRPPLKFPWRIPKRAHEQALGSALGWLAPSYVSRLMSCNANCTILPSATPKATTGGATLDMNAMAVTQQAQQAQQAQLRQFRARLAASPVAPREARARVRDAIRDWVVPVDEDI